jgi:Primase C terminal 2 (PriCT-2)
MVGMALRELDDDGLNLWDEWSQWSDYKYDPAALAEKWTTFLAGDECGGVTLGTLFHVAMEAGWPGPSDVIEEHDGAITRRIDLKRRRGTIHITRAPETRRSS